MSGTFLGHLPVEALIAQGQSALESNDTARVNSIVQELRSRKSKAARIHADQLASENAKTVWKGLTWKESAALLFAFLLLGAFYLITRPSFFVRVLDLWFQMPMVASLVIMAPLLCLIGGSQALFSSEGIRLSKKSRLTNKFGRALVGLPLLGLGMFLLTRLPRMLEFFAK